MQLSLSQLQTLEVMLKSQYNIEYAVLKAMKKTIYSNGHFFWMIEVQEARIEEIQNQLKICLNDPILEEEKRKP